MVRPAPLPIEIALERESFLNQPALDKIWRISVNRASKKLNKSKAKNAVAILGYPSEALKHDPKFQGDYLRDSTKCGESLARATLASEFYVLDLAGIPRHDQRRFVGRSQCPEIVRRPFFPSQPNGKRFASPEMAAVSCVCNHFPAIFDNNGDLSFHIAHIVGSFLDARDASPAHIRDMIDETNGDLDSLYYALGDGTGQMFYKLHGLFNLSLDSMLADFQATSDKHWRDFCKFQFGNTANPLFGFISRSE